MTKIEKLWFDIGYNRNQCGEHPEAVCQERWLYFIELGGDVPTLVKYFPFYKQGATKAFNKKKQITWLIKKLKQVGQEGGVVNTTNKTTGTKSSREMFVIPHGTQKHPRRMRVRSMVEPPNTETNNG